MNRRDFLKGGAGVMALSAGGCVIGPAANKPELTLGKKLPPILTDCKVVKGMKFAGKKMAAMYIDDVIWCLRDISRQRPKSVFDHGFFGGLRKIHDRYGLKLQLNLFYRTDFFYGTDEFTLADVPDVYKSEFQANKDWLRFSLHSLQEFPDYPWVNAEYRDVACVFDRICGEVNRFAGPGCFAYAIVPHWVPMSKAGCKALADRKVKLVSATCGDRYEYTGNRDVLPYGHGMKLESNRKPEGALFHRVSNNLAIASSICSYNHISPGQCEQVLGTFAAIYDNATRLCYKWYRNGPMFNLSDMCQIRQETEAVLGKELICFGDHEQYFYRDYFAYQPDYMAKIEHGVRLVIENGYEFCFLEETID